MKKISILILATIAIVIGCNKVQEEYISNNPSDYLPTAKGKYITYRLDSTVTQSFGSGFVTRSYIVKDSVIDEIIDNTGVRSFRIYRYMRSINGTWSSTNTFLLSPKGATVELIENNLRYISLTTPITLNQQWKGNSFISQSPYYPNSIFNTWNYRYQDIGAPKTFGSLTFPKTVTVVQFDSTENRPFNPKVYNFYDKGYEIYAEKVGLIYRDIMSWEYQAFSRFSNCKFSRPNAAGGRDTIAVNCNDPFTNCDSIRNRPNHTINCDTIVDRFYYQGYGIKQTVIGHN